jgi:hypothetical protein
VKTAQADSTKTMPPTTNNNNFARRLRALTQDIHDLAFEGMGFALFTVRRLSVDAAGVGF